MPRELVLVLGLVVLPLPAVPVCGSSLRTCLVALSQHFCVAVEDIEPGDEERDDEVCAEATPENPTKIVAAAIKAIFCMNAFL